MKSLSYSTVGNAINVKNKSYTLKPCVFFQNDGEMGEDVDVKCGMRNVTDENVCGGRVH